MGYQNDNIAVGSSPIARATRSSSRPAPQAEAFPSLSEPQKLPEVPGGRGRPRKIAPKPAPQKQEPPKKRGRPLKRKLVDENQDDDDVVVIESASTPAPKAMGKGKQDVVPIAFAPPHSAVVAPPAVLQPFLLTQEPPQKQAKFAPSASKSSGTAPEKRAKLWRKQPPKAVSERISRCLTQRMVVLDRQRVMENDIPQEIVKIAGSTGNVYTVHIKQVPVCDCPDSSPTCKHILYVMMKVLKARSDLVYQAALLSSELREVFAKASPIHSSGGESAGSSAQKPLDEDDCPICYCPFEKNGREVVVYCKAQCGTNIHQSCFRQWASTRGAGTVTCVMCRQPWQGDSDPHEALAKGKVNSEGYVNVASELGMSGHRDYSTYYYPPYYGGGFRRRHW